MSRQGWLRCVAVCAASLVVTTSVEPCLAGRTVGGPRRVLCRQYRATTPRLRNPRHGRSLCEVSGAPDEAAFPPERPEHAPRFAGSQAQERIRQTLKKPVSVDFQETPLDFAVAFLEDSCAIPVVIDSKGLKEIGIGPDARVSLRVSRTSLRSALRLILRPLDLGYTICGDALLITTPERAELHLTVGTYPVEDLVSCRDEFGNLWEDYDTLIRTVTSTVVPESWTDVGGPATISGATLGSAKVLVISQTTEAHDEIRDLFRHIRQIGSTSSGDQPPRRNRPAPPSGVGYMGL